MDGARTQVRRLGALAASTMAVIYLLIGLGVLDIGGSATGEAVDHAMFGFSAGLAFLILALLFLFTDRRSIWALALASQVWVSVVYVAVSGTREPAFEVWGIILRLIQVPLLGALIYLVWKAPTARSAGSAR